MAGRQRGGERIRQERGGVAECPAALPGVAPLFSADEAGMDSFESHAGSLRWVREAGDELDRRTGREAKRYIRDADLADVARRGSRPGT